MSTTLTLYVGRDRRNAHRNDTGSTLCVHLLQDLPDGYITTEDATLIPLRDRPLWLHGTPTLFCQATGQVYKGFDAYNEVYRRVKDHVLGLSMSARPPNLGHQQQ